MATILIVDDLAAGREFLVKLLRGRGHRLLEAADGKEGLDAVQAEHPDLVITDVFMPVMNGYEFVRRLRLDPASRGTPVLLYVASFGEREARAFARSSGASWVLKKPAKPDEVLKIVGRVLAGAPETRMPPDAAQPAAGFDRDHLEMLTAELSEQAGDLKIYNARLRALINIGLEISSERDSDRLLHSVCAAARDLFGATYVTIGILDLEVRTVQRVVACGTEAPRWVKSGDPVPGILGRVVAERRALRGENPGGDPAGLKLPALHPDVQAYLASPIASRTRVYGWICSVSNEGRTFTEDDELLAMALSGQIGRVYESGHFHAMAQKRAEELEHEILVGKLAMEAVRTAEERTRFALEAARVGIWDMDYTAGVLQWSKTLEAHYGLQPGTFGGTFEAFVELIHPDDRESVLETVARAMKSGSDFWLQNRTIWPDGTVRWLNGVGRVLLGRNGEPVRAAGISLDVTERHSAVGRDTTFKVSLPRAEAGERAVEAPPPVSRPRAGTQTVLVVDDAEEVRELARRLLQRQGYTVLVAANAEEALRLLEWNKSIDVLLTDVVMPGGSGPELAAWMVEQWPKLRVVYMSGHTAEAIAHHGVLNPGIAFVHKPFTSETLGRKIREVLDR